MGRRPPGSTSNLLGEYDLSEEKFKDSVGIGLPLIYVPKVPVGFLGNSSGQSEFCRRLKDLLFDVFCWDIVGRFMEGRRMQDWHSTCLGRYCLLTQTDHLLLMVRRRAVAAKPGTNGHYGTWGDQAQHPNFDICSRSLEATSHTEKRHNY